MSRLPDTLPPDATATRLVAAIVADGADLDGAIAIIDAVQIRVFTGSRSRRGE